jgi:hypothetical protein
VRLKKHIRRVKAKKLKKPKAPSPKPKSDWQELRGQMEAGSVELRKSMARYARLRATLIKTIAESRALLLRNEKKRAHNALLAARLRESP